MQYYGLPYMGSKNFIADWVCSHLPPADNFYDLFCGGCAITHRMLLLDKYKQYTINDIEPLIANLFYDAVNGKFANETRWISREDFFELKESDGYIKYCWSFGNLGKSYLYGLHVEPWKKAVHYARVFGDTSLLKEFGIDSDGSQADIVAHHEEYKAKYIEWVGQDCSITPMQLQRLQSLQRLQRLQSLQRLQRLQSLQRFNTSYDQIEIKPNSVIYCDIPYRNTAEYSLAFDYDKFYDWCSNQTEPVYISEYWMPEDDFVCIASKVKNSTFSSTNNACRSIEKIFVPKHQYTPNSYKYSLFD